MPTVLNLKRFLLSFKSKSEAYINGNFFQLGVAFYSTTFLTKAA